MEKLKTEEFVDEAEILSRKDTIQKVPSKKPREFWIKESNDNFYHTSTVAPRPPSKSIHVREVIEISEAEIALKGKEYHDYTWSDEGQDKSLVDDTKQAFEAGFRAAIAKMRGGE